MDMLGTNIGSERMAAIREAGEALLAQESQRGERAHQRVLATLTVNRIGVAAMTALSLLALFMYFRQARALEQSRASQVLAVQAERDHLLALPVLFEPASRIAVDRQLEHHEPGNRGLGDRQRLAECRHYWPFVA